MSETTLTLATDLELLLQLKSLADESQVDVEHFVIRYLEALAKVRSRPLDRENLPPLTQRAIGLLKTPGQGSNDELVRDALMERHQ